MSDLADNSTCSSDDKQQKVGCNWIGIGGVAHEEWHIREHLSAVHSLYRTVIGLHIVSLSVHQMVQIIQLEVYRQVLLYVLYCSADSKGSKCLLSFTLPSGFEKYPDSRIQYTPTVNKTLRRS